MCLWSWAVSQAPGIFMVRLGISICSIGSCIVSPTSHKKQVVFRKGYSSQRKELKENCTKWRFWVETPVLVWLVKDIRPFLLALKSINCQCFNLYSICSIYQLKVTSHTTTPIYSQFSIYSQNTISLPICLNP